MSEHTGVAIPDHPNYTITEYGQIFSISHNWRGYGAREMTQNKNSYGYPSVRLTTGAKRKRFPVHKLVALTYLDEMPIWATELRHLDGDKTNNHMNNLAWGNAKLNAMDREAHGNTSSGESHSVAIKRGIRKSTNKYWRHAR